MRSLLVLLPLLALSSCSFIRPTTQPLVTQAVPIHPPKVTIRNLGHQKIMVGLRGPETQMIPIPGQSTQTITLTAGTYRWAATAEDQPVRTGTRAFMPQGNYTWDFNLD